MGDESLVKFLKTSDEEKFKCATMRRGSVIKRTFLRNQIVRLSSIYGSLIAINSVDYESLESSKLHSDWFREITFSRFIKINCDRTISRFSIQLVYLPLVFSVNSMAWQKNHKRVYG